MLQLFSRAEFERTVREHKAERHARDFTCWGQFVAMLFCHLARAQWVGQNKRPKWARTEQIAKRSWRDDDNDY